MMVHPITKRVMARTSMAKVVVMEEKIALKTLNGYLIRLPS